MGAGADTSETSRQRAEPEASPGTGAGAGARADRPAAPAPAGAPKSDPEPATTVALVGFAAPVVGLIEPALAGDGYAVSRVALDADTVRTLVKAKPRVIVLDCHPYLDARALLADLRAATDLAQTPVVAVGPPEAPEVPGLEVVRQPGRALELDRLMQAISRAAGKYTG